VTFVAPGPTAAEDPDHDWAARLAAHQASRPAHWRTLETRDLAAALSGEEAVIVDCLGTWLSATIDAANAWEADLAEVSALVGSGVDALLSALAARPASAGPVVLVTNEVGLGVVPAHRSGRLFRDLLGTVNQRVGAACDEVHLVIAGRALVL
jgi:adenosylcobinamide kinase/adenosylcobinamide-phosphate guanylyltransferase